ncbi:hypothetical protein O181_065764 [Austropuccinia psidii MF-1]|uniref:Mitochondrial import inner membrane translocase subunit TIM22 n=1 Tax=Austropuccinia psidii MF-1 TaxID=1389203 RepID=A0A9Q3ERP1_9BASI|nr:hypothetical protein [Austropuccinia psidii MF-1]
MLAHRSYAKCLLTGHMQFETGEKFSWPPLGSWDHRRELRQLWRTKRSLEGVERMSSGFLPPYIIPGQEPGTTPEQRQEIYKYLHWTRLGQAGQESCIAKTIISGTMGFGLGAMFSLMSSSFAYEDPLRRDPNFDSMKLDKKARVMFREMGRGMWSTGKGFGKVGALYAGMECCVESYRAKNDLWNSLAGGAMAGGILAWKSGMKAMMFGAVGFAAFSGAIDAYMRKEPVDDD